ncbi:hypothetical protein [uncultured Oscillibacter sp.]|uniref:hypothetical protein n=1 Tax=uncultured Oscillibacter sp. TaxID=876091 RepID=UPI00260F71C7|nr:hypothetical protein [uncultured Oscillibacter sp.]
MKKQLAGFAWMFFGLLLYFVLRDVWTPVIGDYIWAVSLLCGIAGLVTVLRHSGSGD